MNSQIDKTIQDRKFTQAEVEQQWKVFFNNQGEKGMPLLHVKVKVEEGNKIKLNLNNRNREFFKPFKERLIRFLRNRLHNINITFDIIQEKKANQNTSLLPVSNVEKFDFLSKKHPILKRLKERFGLQVEN